MEDVGIIPPLSPLLLRDEASVRVCARYAARAGVSERAFRWARAFGCRVIHIL
jgi:hypothetical protein